MATVATSPTSLPFKSIYSPRPLSIDQRHQSNDKSFPGNGDGDGGVHNGSGSYGTSKGLDQIKLNWFPFPSSPKDNRTDMRSQATGSTTQTTTAQHETETKTVGYSPPYAGSFHGLGSLPLGADYGSTSSTSGMDALSEAAAARSAEDRAGHTSQFLDRAESRSWAGEYRSNEPERRTGTGYWKTRPREEVRSPKRKRDDVEKDINDLRGHIHELIHMMRPFASRSPHHDPAPPPLYLQSHFHRMSKIIHSSLLSISPHVAPRLDGFSFDRMHVDRGERSDAEREMEVIRKRRDMLISRAAQAKLHPLPRIDLDMAPSRSRSGPSSRSRTPTQSRSRSRSASPPLARLPAMAARSAGSGSRSASPGASPRRHAAVIDHERDEYASRPRDPRDGTPLGRCHGCGSGALHWRRGPDGPKSLCDSCGLHYAKLSRSSASPRSYQQPFTSHRIPEIKGQT